MSSQDGSSSSSGDYARFAGNTRIRELGCYVDLNGSFYEVPRLDVEQNFRWELMAQSVDVIYPHGVRGANRIVVDVMSYRQRKWPRQKEKVTLQEICYITLERHFIDIERKLFKKKLSPGVYIYAFQNHQQRNLFL